MAKFRIRLKVQALELEIDGERDDIPMITSAVQNQLGGLVQAAGATADDHQQPENGQTPTILDVSDSRATGRKSRRRSTSPRSTTEAGSGQPIEFRHDPSKHGSPQQNWSIIDKCVWLLFVIQEATGTKEVSGSQLAATFNEKFRQAGRIHPPHATRELGKAKLLNPAAVGEDKSLWFLTDEGVRQARQLIDGLLGQQS